MKKFERLHSDDQVDILLEMMRLFFDYGAKPFAAIAAARNQTPLEFWRQVCADVGVDTCEPWEGYPAPPKRDCMKDAPGADRPLPDYLQRLLDRWKANYPQAFGRQ